LYDKPAAFGVVMLTWGRPLPVGRTCGRLTPGAVGSAMTTESPAKHAAVTDNAMTNATTSNVLLNMAMLLFLFAALFLLYFQNV
jgi:hypothetical protein